MRGALRFGSVERVNGGSELASLRQELDLRDLETLAARRRLREPQEVELVLVAVQIEFDVVALADVYLRAELVPAGQLRRRRVAVVAVDAHVEARRLRQHA